MLGMQREGPLGGGGGQAGADDVPSMPHTAFDPSGASSSSRRAYSDPPDMGYGPGPRANVTARRWRLPHVTVSEEMQAASFFLFTVALVCGHLGFAAMRGREKMVRTVEM
mmetsp:Transcript_34178/g.66787  ORF Transcript_34178/g.66787 Transcript_34178/m.66787 type:complete len:110 (-) Transcript_34178:193-522(-)